MTPEAGEQEYCYIIMKDQLMYIIRMIFLK